MIVKMFMILDAKADAFNLPFCMATRGLAVREFTEQANSKESMIGRYPDDYSLYEIAEFDTQDGKISPYEVRKLIGTGRDYVEVV